MRDPIVELAGENIRVLACLGQGLFLVVVGIFRRRIRCYLDTDEMEWFSFVVLDNDTVSR